MDSGNSGGSLQSSSGGGGGGDDFDAASGGGSADSPSSTSPLAALLRHPGFGAASPLIYGLQDLGAPPLSSRWCSMTVTAPALPPPTAGAGASPPSMSCHGGGGLASATSAPAAADHQTSSTAARQQPSAPLPRGSSRKRARASRRAPTTVLTTDTSNFRAMVQEFTGIPAPPFAAAGARSRLDHHLFPSRSPAALPQYLLRPFVHKPQTYPPPFTSTSTSSPAPATAAIAAPAGASTAAMASSDGYQHHLTTAAPPALLGMQNHGGGGGSRYLSFQSALAAGQLDSGGGGDAGKYPLFDRGVAPLLAPRPLQDPADFLGLAHQRNGDRSGNGADELSGLVGGCKATYSTAPPLLERINGRGPAAGASTATTTTAPRAPVTAATRTQGVDSWVCSTSE
ncbi:unnamed protein product [Urochloa humidicola]